MGAGNPRMVFFRPSASEKLNECQKADTTGRYSSWLKGEEEEEEDDEEEEDEEDGEEDTGHEDAWGQDATGQENAGRAEDVDVVGLWWPGGGGNGGEGVGGGKGKSQPSARGRATRTPPRQLAMCSNCNTCAGRQTCWRRNHGRRRQTKRRRQHRAGHATAPPRARQHP